MISSSIMGRRYSFWKCKVSLYQPVRTDSSWLAPCRVHQSTKINKRTSMRSSCMCNVSDKTQLYSWSRLINDKEFWQITGFEKVESGVMASFQFDKLTSKLLSFNLKTFLSTCTSIDEVLVVCWSSCLRHLDPYVDDLCNMFWQLVRSYLREAR